MLAGLLALGAIALAARFAGGPAAAGGPAVAVAPEPTRVRAAGLSQPATVITDRWGIPHIRAASLDDLYYAWGWVSARDRLWQMVWTRAAGDGQTHRWIGNDALRADGGAQLLRLRERAHALWARDQADPALRAALERYSAGVNAWLESCRRGERAWPPELRRLKLEPPDWRPEDCYVVLLGFGITLDLDLPELSEARAVADSGAGWAANRRRYEDRWIMDSIPDSAAARLWPWRGTSPTSSASPSLDAGAGARHRGAGLPEPVLAAGERVLEAFPRRDPEGADRASDEFVVGARRSASGKPILANDPHLGLATPGPFHVLHVSVPGVVDAVGGGVPGLPVIVVGRNPRAAWGVTSLSADVVDVYADTLSADGRRVRTHAADGAAGWAAVRSLPYDLHYRVMGLAGLSLPVPPWMQARRYTPHGPVLVWEPKHHLALSARWSAMEDDAISARRLLGLERSTSAAEVCERFATLVTPCLNVVAADVDGDARYRSVGLLPVRARLPGLGPVPSDGRHEWLGFVPADSMPQWRVPSRGFLVNGNNRPVGPHYPYPLPRFDWPHDRARRLAQRLAGDASITVEDAASVQNDVFSLAAGRNVPLLLQCADSLRESLPPRARAACDTLRAWNLRAVRSQVAPTLYRAWYGAYQRRSQLEGLPGLAFAALESRAPGTLGAPGQPGRFETPAVAASAALAMALDSLAAKLGPDLATWRYGRAHRARFRHTLAALDSRARWEPPLTPEDGDNATPSVGPSRLPFSLEVVHGPAFRHVVDLARPMVSYGVVPPWNSAAFPPRGELDLDLRRRWADHGYAPLYLDPKRIDEVAIDRVTLAPR
jgi:penicillin amidase